MNEIVRQMRDRKAREKETKIGMRKARCNIDVLLVNQVNIRSEKC